MRTWDPKKWMEAGKKTQGAGTMCEEALRWEGGQLRTAKASVASSHEQGVGGCGGWSGSLGQKTGWIHPGLGTSWEDTREGTNGKSI